MVVTGHPCWWVSLVRRWVMGWHLSYRSWKMGVGTTSRACCVAGQRSHLISVALTFTIPSLPHPLVNYDLHFLPFPSHLTVLPLPPPSPPSPGRLSWVQVPQGVEVQVLHRGSGLTCHPSQFRLHHLQTFNTNTISCYKLYWTWYFIHIYYKIYNNLFDITDTTKYWWNPNLENVIDNIIEHSGNSLGGLGVVVSVLCYWAGLRQTSRQPRVCIISCLDMRVSLPCHHLHAVSPSSCYSSPSWRTPEIGGKQYWLHKKFEKSDMMTQRRSKLSVWHRLLIQCCLLWINFLLYLE